MTFLPMAMKQIAALLCLQATVQLQLGATSVFFAHLKTCQQHNAEGFLRLKPRKQVSANYWKGAEYY